MTSRYTPTVKGAKATTAKCATPSTLSTTPIKPARATLSTTKKLSAVARPTLIKQTSACDLRERLRLHQNDDVLNTGFTASSSFTSKLTTKSKLSTPIAMSASSSSLSGATSATAKSIFSTYSSKNVAAKRLFGNSTPTIDRTPSAQLVSTPDCFSKVLLDTQTPQNSKRSCETPQSYRKSNELGDDNKSKEKGEDSNLTVSVRVRPMNAKECTTPRVKKVITVQDSNKIMVKSGINIESYAYDNVFCSYDTDDTENYADQEAVFNGTALPLIDKAFEGYNTCLFAYGQTGSGKSYSMMGIDTDAAKPNREAGIIPRFCYELFRRIDETKDQFTAQVEVSYFEIYNEKIHDLLAVTPTHLSNATAGNQNNRQTLQVREHPRWGPYIENLNIHPVDSNIALKNWMAVGNSQRATAATGMNDKSSRSHSIFSIILTLTEKDSESSKVTRTKRSRINLIDLAGSERVSQTCASGDRLKEGVSINKSLLTLGKVINALAKNTFAPYRESVLTFLLKESLGGNSKTAMLATISPASVHVDETLATLRYACQARSIVNRVKVNEDLNNRKIHELQTEVDRLRAQVQYYQRQEIQAVEAPPRKIIIETIEANPNDEHEKEKLRQQLREKEYELANAQKSWRERLEEAKNKCKNEMKLLQQNGLALQLSDAQKSHPCLINLATDPMLSGTLLYILPPGVVRIGKPKPSDQAQSDIVLDGLWVGLNHCQIENRRGKLFIRPDMDDCETFVNGELLQNERQIYHGDRIVIGRSHYFRVSNPKCSGSGKTEVVDYQGAHEEIVREEKKRLELEFKAAQEAAIRKIEEERTKHELSYNEKVAQLELEQFRYKCSKELIDAEKEVMARNHQEESDFVYRPFESDLIDKIKRMMERPTKEGMHETQLMVKEATQRCRNLGLNYDFVQNLVADESEVFKAVVKIIDRQNNRFAEWPTARLSVWLDLMRDNSDVTAANAFDSVDIKWLENTEEIPMNESLNSSRISLDLSAMKETLLGKPIKSCFKAIQNKLSPWSSKGQSNTNANQLPSVTEKASHSEIGHSLLKTKKKLSYDDFDEIDENTNEKPKKPFNNIESGLSTSTPVEEKFEVQAQKYLNDLRKTTIRMKKLCHNQYNENFNVKDQATSGKVFTALEEIEHQINQIRHLIRNNESSPRKTPKSVRFILD